jgi:TonB family protein
MDHPSIPFHRPLVASVAVHVLLFGTALAFAHYGEVLFGSSSRVITVDLVGDGGTASSTRPEPVRTARAASMAAPAAPALPDLKTPREEVATAKPGGAATVDDAIGKGSAGVSAPMGENAGLSAGVGPGRSSSGAGLLSEEQWRMLQSALEKAKNYPRLARERGIEGTVLVRFRVLRSGEVREVRVVKSSGAAILDEASVKTVNSAGPMPYVDGWIEVPMVYQLQ